MIADFAENLLQAMEIISQSSLEDLGCDVTIICTITNNSNSGRGEYTVTDGSSTFFAYTDKIDYEVNDTVYVTVPKGNFGLPKLISGRYIDTSSATYVYKSPWKQFVDITGDLVFDDQEGNSGSILANGDTTHKALISIDGIGEEGAEYTCIGLKAGFKTAFGDTAISYGSYGIYLYVDYETIIGSSNLKNTRTVRFRLDQSDMYGNPYRFENFYTQSKIFDISGIGTVKNIRVEIFQEKGSFKNDSDQVFSSLYLNEDNEWVPKPDNIFVDDIYLALGYNIEDFNSDKVFLYTPSSKQYKENDDELEKTMKVRWIHIIDLANKEIECYNSATEILGLGTLHWYKENLRSGASDKWAGAGWQEITLEEDHFEVKITPSTNAINERYKVIIETPPYSSLELQAISTDEEIAALKVDLDGKAAELENAISSFENAQTANNYSIKVNVQKRYDEAKERYDRALANYVADLQTYESNVLEFVNLDPPSDADFVGGLNIICDEENYKGVYFLYNTSNKLVNKNEADVKRILRAEYQSVNPNTDEDQGAITSISWKIPLVNTMIEMPREEIEYVRSATCSISYSEDKQYLYIMRSNETEDLTIQNEAKDADLTQIFRIKNYYSQTATNNSIQCIITRKGQKYESTVTLAFGPKGTNGTDYTFIMKMESGRNCLFKNDFAPVKIYTQLLNYNNEYITLLEGTQVKINWYAKDDIQKVAFCNADGKIGFYDKDDEERTNLKYSNKPPKTAIIADSLTLIADGLSDKVEFYIRNLDDNEIASYNAVNDNIIPLYTVLGAALVQEATSNGTNLGKVQLTTTLSIPCSGGDNYDHIEGEDKIIYATDGTLESYYANPYKVFNQKNQEIENVLWYSIHDEPAYVLFSNQPVTKRQWRIFHDYGKIKFFTKNNNTYTEMKTYSSLICYVQNKDAAATGSIVYNDDNNYYPQIIERSGQLVPNSTYLSTISKKICLLAKNDKEEIIWAQPLIIYQDVYTSALLNAWNNTLTIDEESSTIMAAMLGAGFKDENNRFNGVLMGAVNKAGGDKCADTGLYGYHEGAQSFGLDIDGTAFFGKSGRGRIEFDGNTGVIQSASYNQNEVIVDGVETKVQTGIKIDLDDGYIDVRGSSLTSLVNEEKITGEEDDTEDYENMHDAIEQLLSEYTSLELNAQLALNALGENENPDYRAVLNKKIKLYQDYERILKQLDGATTFGEAEILEVKFDTRYIKQNTVLQQRQRENEQALSRAQAEFSSTSHRLETELQQGKITQAQYNTQLDAARVKQNTAIASYYSTKNDLNHSIQQLSELKDSLAVHINDYKNAYNSNNSNIDDLMQTLEAQAQDYTTFLDQLTAVEDILENAQTQYEEFIESQSSIKTLYEQSCKLSIDDAIKNEIIINLLEENNISFTDLILNTSKYNATYESTNSRVKISALSPYFYIQSKAGNPLINIADDEYYLQTDNFHFDEDAPEENAGLRLDLQNGNLSAYSGFKLAAYEDPKNYIIISTDGSPNGDPYIQVHKNRFRTVQEQEIEEELDLLFINKEQFFLQSQNWLAADAQGLGGQGMQIDLTNGNMTAYSGFNLRAYQDKDNYILLTTSGEPYFQVTSSGKDLMKIGKNGNNMDFYLQSTGWDANNKTGLKLDLSAGSLTAYSGFNLLAYGKTDNAIDTNKYIQLDSSNTTYPFQVIGYSGTGNNRIDQYVRTTWNGQLEANSGLIGPFSMTPYYFFFSVPAGLTAAQQKQWWENAGKDANNYFKKQGFYLGRYGLSFGTNEKGTFDTYIDAGARDPKESTKLAYIDNTGLGHFRKIESEESVSLRGSFSGHFGGTVTCSKLVITDGGTSGKADDDSKTTVTISANDKQLGQMAYVDSVAVNFKEPSGEGEEEYTLEINVSDIPCSGGPYYTLGENNSPSSASPKANFSRTYKIKAKAATTERSIAMTVTAGGEATPAELDAPEVAVEITCTQS